MFHTASSRHPGAAFWAVALILSIAVPATAESRSGRACQENLMKIDGSKEQFALEYRLPHAGTVTWQNVLDPEATGKLGNGYLKKKPVCPDGGTYTLNVVGKCPTCSIGKSKAGDVSHALPDCMEASATTSSATLPGAAVTTATQPAP